jgi:ATP-dependent Clp protease adaptor protein ClpS
MEIITNTRPKASGILHDRAKNPTPLSQSQCFELTVRNDYIRGMSASVTPKARPDLEKDTDPRSQLDPGYLVICWNDPVNLMDYVTHVFQTVFGWSRPKATKHMREVHEQGKSVLTRENMEKAEFYVHELQKYTLHATLERDSS